MKIYVSLRLKRQEVIVKKGRCDIGKLRDAVENNLHYRLGVYVGVLKRMIDLCWIEKEIEKSKKYFDEL